jgi:hypothetical protein
MYNVESHFKIRTSIEGVFESRLLRMCRSKRKEMTGGWKMLHNAEVCSFAPRQIFLPLSCQGGLNSQGMKSSERKEVLAECGRTTRRKQTATKIYAQM